MEAIHVDDRERIAQAALTNQTAGAYDEEYRIVRPDGTIRWIRDRAFPVRDGGGEVVRVAGVAEDITERRRLEAQLRQAQKMEAVGRLAGGIAHDFNNLLTVILGYSELLLEPSATTRAAATARGNRKAGQRAAALTRQLLAFSRRQVLQPQVSRPQRGRLEIAEDAAARHRRADRADDRAQRRLGGIEADAGQLEQVLVNLGVNARDAMPHGGQLTHRDRARRRARTTRRCRRGIPRQLRRAGGHRHRLRNARGSNHAHLRAVFHDEGAGKGHRPRACRGVRHRQAERRLRRRQERTRRRHRSPIFLPVIDAGGGLAAASPSRRGRRLAAPRRFCSSKTTTPCAPSRSASYSDAATPCWKRAGVPMASASRRRIARRSTS